MSSDQNKRLPLYVQIEEALATRISEGLLAIGHQLPPEDELIREFGVSRTTVRTTIQNLVRRGLVEIRRGRGTFVSAPCITQPLTELTGFVEDMLLQSRKPSARVIDRRIIPADSLVASKLQVAEGTMVVQILRVRLADDVPLSLDETYLPERLGRRVLNDDLTTQPIFTLLEQRYDTPLLEAEYDMGAVLAEPKVAFALEVDSGTPIFQIDRTSYSVNHRPVDYERLYYRGDLIRFRTRLERKSGQRSLAQG
jgi:GntR family transcriptional regulator